MIKIEKALNSLYRKIAGKQDALTAGQNITIEGGVISAAGTDLDPIREAIAGKQDIISGGDGVFVSDNTVSLAPTEVVAQKDASAVFSVAAYGSGVSYQWQYSATGKTYNNTSLSGNKTNTLTVVASAGRQGYHYRCLITAGGTTYTTRPFKLVILT